jgi:hypothetical protein
VLYDEGKVKYNYTYTESNKGVRKFRVKVLFSLLEVLCTDLRCPGIGGIYTQRVNEMSKITGDKLTEVTYRTMCEWYPQRENGIDSAKFLRLIKEMRIFPDIRRGPRVSQLEELFKSQAKQDIGSKSRVVLLDGFRQLLKDMALIRFPPPKQAESFTINEDDEENEDEDGDEEDKYSSADKYEEGSVAGRSVGASTLNSSYINARGGGGKGGGGGGGAGRMSISKKSVSRPQSGHAKRMLSMQSTRTRQPQEEAVLA